MNDLLDSLSGLRDLLASTVPDNLDAAADLLHRVETTARAAAEFLRGFKTVDMVAASSATPALVAESAAQADRARALMFDFAGIADAAGRPIVPPDGAFPVDPAAPVRATLAGPAAGPLVRMLLARALQMAVAELLAWLESLAVKPAETVPGA